ncbi:microcystin-dependent protein [Bartonella callosciuri]|uniref:Microcystin-dependent protein n=1 Tax=Bartonella callosciuri TaxID=686223 RepID=A0A840NWN1_9HYPH|nr:phage tail protein [Bartonella callosciuri]MBB5074333.1 microcystin-dependent protein [Bartonella callosciuri]
MSSIYDWSLIASENAYADEIINWAEGQPPSSVNDSARAMMQRIKEYLSDNGGVIETQFTVDGEQNKTSIRLTTKSVFETYRGGIVVRFKAQEINRGITNVALNQLPFCPVYQVTSEGIAPLKGQEIQKGALYELVYTCDIAGKNADGWFLTNPTIKLPEIPPFPPLPESFSPGFIGTFAMEKIPTGWLLCDGKAYSRSTYANLFAALGETWGKGDGNTTFNVPDLRGMFLRGLDSGKEIDKGRRLGSRQEESFKAHTHKGKTNSAGKHLHSFIGLKPISVTAADSDFMYHPYGFDTKKSLTEFEGEHSHEILLETTGGDETRPVNVAVVYAVKA